MDGAGSGAETVARSTREAESGGGHQDGQAEKSVGIAALPVRLARSRVFRNVVLGRNGPGSEGNLASDNENTRQSVAPPPPESEDKPAGNQSEKSEKKM